MRFPISGLTLALLACHPGSSGSGGSGLVADPPLPGPDWTQFRRDPHGTSAASAPLTADQARSLHEVWSHPTAANLWSQPVARGDTVWVALAGPGGIVALDAATGAERWARKIEAVVQADCGTPERPGTWGAPAVDGDTVYVAAADGDLHALDAGTGDTRWKAHVADPTPHGELIETSVVLAGGKAWLGVASTAHCDQIPGRLAAVDLATHAVSQRTLVPDGQRGAAVWASPAVEGGRVYLATGNAEGDRTKTPLAQAVVALDAASLVPLASWQNPTALTNADFGGAPTYFVAGGKAMLAAAAKDGWVYAFDAARIGDGPAWRREVATVDPAHPDAGGDPLAGFGSIVPPAFSGGLLFLGGGRTPGGDPGSVVAVDPGTGDVRWTRALPGPVLQPAVAAGGVLAVVTTWFDDRGSTLQLLDAGTGEPLKAFTSGAPSLAPPTWAGGALYWATMDGVVHALRP
ncbi:MAG: PQQ-binding-like beta-propeller repeat protein [Anaeromyxobacteraceae bacterium]